MLLCLVPVQFTVLPQNVTVIQENRYVSCDTSGFCEPFFTWTKAVSKTRQLNIPRSHRSSTGMYVCNASNGVGQDETTKICYRAV